MRRRKIELSVNIYEQSACDCPRQESHRISSNYRFFMGQRCIAALHKVFYARMQHHITAYAQPMIADTSSQHRFCTLRD